MSLKYNDKMKNCWLVSLDLQSFEQPKNFNHSQRDSLFRRPFNKRLLIFEQHSFPWNNQLGVGFHISRTVRALVPVQSDHSD